MAVIGMLHRSTVKILPQALISCDSIGSRDRGISPLRGLSLASTHGRIAIFELSN